MAPKYTFNLKCSPLLLEVNVLEVIGRAVPVPSVGVRGSSGTGAAGVRVPGLARSSTAW